MKTLPIRVAVCGAAGRMGREVVRAVSEAADTGLVAAIDRSEVGRDAGSVAGIGVFGLSIGDDLEDSLELAEPMVLVDFTVPSSAMRNIETALRAKIAPVVRPTGLT